MSTCKACDSVLEPWEETWNEELKQHNDKCTRCTAASSNPYDYGDIIDDMFIVPEKYEE